VKEVETCKANHRRQIGTNADEKQMKQKRPTKNKK
jgi:hypothetical protein